MNTLNVDEMKSRSQLDLSMVLDKDSSVVKASSRTSFGRNEHQGTQHHTQTNAIDNHFVKSSVPTVMLSKDDNHNENNLYSSSNQKQQQQKQEITRRSARSGVRDSSLSNSGSNSSRQLAGKDHDGDDDDNDTDNDDNDHSIPLRSPKRSRVSRHPK
jgi:hypothetical protein